MQRTLLEKAEIPHIRTPDQRLRVFVSSTLQELAPEREVVRNAIERLRLIPVLFELGARPHPPRDLYRAYLSQSHIFIAIYWQRYGWVAPGMNISGLEDEYQLSEHMPRLIYIKIPAPNREPGMIDLLGKLKNDDRACYKYFSTLEELEELITNDLIILLSERFERSSLNESIVVPQDAGTPNNLPSELTRFIGREKPVAVVSNLLKQEDIRLVTLTGPGGVGKTRLALKVASRMLSQFQNGVWLVELAPRSDPTLVVQYIANVLGIREEENRPLVQTVIDQLYGKNMLLILDNCEHLIQAVAQLSEIILRGAPNVRILATSREPLGVAGEMVRCISPLSTPSLQEAIEPERLTQYEAVKLFVDRAIAVRPGFAITSQNASAIAQICARLDGIPLAIELAAARVRVLSVEEIAKRLEDSFRLLVGNRTAIPRQQTLRSLIDWSHALLSDNERILLRRLAVFAGGWTLPAAEEVCSGGDIEASEVLDLLTQLVDKSLVIAEAQGASGRYRFLETIRQYAEDRRAESKESDEFARRHAEYFAKMAEESYGELWGPRQGYWLARLEAEHDNLRTALGWMKQDAGRREMLLRVAGSLWRFWEVHGHISEGRAWLELALAGNSSASAYHRANGLRGGGMLARQQGDYALAIAMHEQSLTLFREMGDKLGIARELDALGEITWLQGDYPKAVELHSESLGLRREIGDKEGIAMSLGHLGIIAHDHGQHHYARELLEESLTLSRELEDNLLTARALNNLGLIAHSLCEYEHAIGLLEEAVSLYREINDRLGISNTLQNLGNVAKDQGYFTQATTLYNECLVLKQELGDKRGIARVTAGLAEVAFFQGDYPRAAELAEQSLTLFQELGVKRGVILSLEIRAFAAQYQGDYEYAFSLAEESLTLSTDLDFPLAIAYARKAFGLVAYARGNQAEAAMQFQEALTIFRKIGDRRNVAHTLVNLARTAYRQGDYTEAMWYLDESLAISRELDIRWSLAFSLEIMGLLQRSQSKFDRALNLFQESLQISVEQANLQGIANCLGAMAGLAAVAGQGIYSARLFAAAEKLRDSMGMRMGSDDREEYEHHLVMLRNQLDESAFEAAWKEGQELSDGGWEQIAAYVIQETNGIYHSIAESATSNALSIRSNRLELVQPNLSP